MRGKTRTTLIPSYTVLGQQTSRHECAETISLKFLCISPALQQLTNGTNSFPNLFLIRLMGGELESGVATVDEQFVFYNS